MTFEELHLSRPILKALAEIGFQHPTPIQEQAIPIALRGQDICGSAVTGSGKTAAFVLPILERLLYRDVKVRVIRVLILTPTRELAIQCHGVITKLAKYTNGIRAALIAGTNRIPLNVYVYSSNSFSFAFIGGMPLKQQELELQSNPDIVVATPGRIVDHILNTKSFGLEDLEILVLDEADRYAVIIQ